MTAERNEGIEPGDVFLHRDGRAFLALNVSTSEKNQLLQALDLQDGAVRLFGCNGRFRPSSFELLLRAGEAG